MVKRAVVLAVVATLVIAPTAMANPTANYGGFTVYPTTDAYDGVFIVPGAAIVQFHVVHIGQEPASAVQFSAPIPECLGGTWVGDAHPFSVVIGNSQIGVSVGYGTCLLPPIHVMTINVIVEDTPPDCCFYELDRDLGDPHGALGEITVVDCEETIFHILAGRSVINPDPLLCPTPVEQSSWGRIKAMYVQ
jgi:hypothetical protein